MMRTVARGDFSRTNGESSRGRKVWSEFIGKLRWGLLAVCVLTGCGRAPASVSGKLTLDGKPLAGSNQMRVTIMFYPEAGGAPAGAVADEQGRYQLATGAQVGLAPGSYTVLVAATESAPTAKEGMSKKRIVTPAEYMDAKKTKLRAEVQPGSNTFDFDLKSGAKSL
jgi:hypothetical protein